MKNTLNIKAAAADQIFPGTQNLVISFRISPAPGTLLTGYASSSEVEKSTINYKL